MALGERPEVMGRPPAPDLVPPDLGPLHHLLHQVQQRVCLQGAERTHQVDEGELERTCHRDYLARKEQRRQK